MNYLAQFIEAEKSEIFSASEPTKPILLGDVEEKSKILCCLDPIKPIKPALLESTPEFGRTFVALEAAPDVDSRTLSEGEAGAQGPAMRELFLREVEKQKGPNGLVSVTPRLCTLWRYAEDECGHALTLSGAERVTNTNRHNSSAKSGVIA